MPEPKKQPLLLRLLKKKKVKKKKGSQQTISESMALSEKFIKKNP